MDINDKLRKANPRIDGPTYRIVRGEISSGEYQRALNAERRRHGLPEIVVPRPLQGPQSS